MSDATRIAEIVARELDLPAGGVGPDATAEDVPHWDSLGHLRICMAVESEYGVTIPLEGVETLRSVPALAEYVATSRA